MLQPYISAGERIIGTVNSFKDKATTLYKCGNGKMCGIVSVIIMLQPYISAGERHLKLLIENGIAATLYKCGYSLKL